MESPQTIFLYAQHGRVAPGSEAKKDAIGLSFSGGKSPLDKRTRTLRLPLVGPTPWMQPRSPV